MKYDPKIHHRKSIRLSDYDYSQKGLYFITLCIQDKTYLLGQITDNAMQQNEAGNMVEKWYKKLESKYPAILCQSMIIMPNHFHCIIEIVKPQQTDLSTIIQWFKTMTTNAYIRNVTSKGWARFNTRLWQRNYWEHVVRNEEEYQQICEYINTNPQKWDLDKLNQDREHQIMESKPIYGKKSWMV